MTTNNLRTGRRPPGTLLTLLALLVLLLRLGAAPMPMESGTGDGPALAVAQSAFWAEPICHADPHDTTGQPASDHPAGHAHDCGLCPLCQAIAAPVLLPGGATVADFPALVRTAGPAVMPPSTGPPRPRDDATRPRGPPPSA